MPNHSGRGPCVGGRRRVGKWFVHTQFSSCAAAYIPDVNTNKNKIYQNSTSYLPLAISYVNVPCIPMYSQVLS